MVGVAVAGVPLCEVEAQARVRELGNVKGERTVVRRGLAEDAIRRLRSPLLDHLGRDHVGLGDWAMEVGAFLLNRTCWADSS